MTLEGLLEPLRLLSEDESVAEDALVAACDGDIGEG